MPAGNAQQFSQRPQALPPQVAGTLPTVLPLPDSTNEGPHLSYAGQWFLFSVVGLVGWPLLLRKVARDQDSGEDAGDVEPTDRDLHRQDA